MILILAVLLIVILRAALTAEPEVPGAEASPAADRQYTTAT